MQKLQSQHPDWPVLARAQGDPTQITAAFVAEAAATGDPDATAILAAARASFAFALTQVIALLAPSRIVIGGGVSLIGERNWFDPIQQNSPTTTCSHPFADNTTSSPPPSASLSSSTVPSPSPAMHSRRNLRDDSIPMPRSDLLRFHNILKIHPPPLDIARYMHALLDRCGEVENRRTALAFVGSRKQTVLLATEAVWLNSWAAARTRKRDFRGTFSFFSNGPNFAPYWSDRCE